MCSLCRWESEGVCAGYNLYQKSGKRRALLVRRASGGGGGGGQSIYSSAQRYYRGKGIAEEAGKCLGGRRIHVLIPAEMYED